MRTWIGWRPAGLVVLGALGLGLQACTSEDAAERSEEAAPVPVEQAADGEGAERPDPSAGAADAIPTISATELLALLDSDDGPAVLDVRTPEEYEAAHVPGAINIPYDQVAAHLDSLEAYRERGLVVYCRTGRRAGIAESVLVDAGFERVWDLAGHMVEWKAYERPLAGTCC